MMMKHYQQSKIHTCVSNDHNGVVIPLKNVIFIIKTIVIWKCFLDFFLEQERKGRVLINKD